MKRSGRIPAALLVLAMLAALLPVPAFADNELQIESAFPDPVLRSYVEQNFDTDENGMLSADETAGAVSIEILGRGAEVPVRSLEGIEYLTSLTEISCPDNQITEINLSAVPQLRRLNLKQNGLNSLNLSPVPDLESLICNENNLRVLDVSCCPKLSHLECTFNSLGTLDVTRNTELAYLDCTSTAISALDVTQNPKLAVLMCSENFLTDLDLTHSPDLTTLFCETNSLTALNVNCCPELVNIECGDNRIGSLDVSCCHELDELNCKNNALTALDINNCPVLRWLNCSGNKIGSLDVSGHQGLTSLFCSSNEMTELKISGARELLNVDCSGNRLACLNTDGCASLHDIKSQGNELYVADGSDTSALPGFDLSRVSNVTGGSLDGGTVSFENGSDEITYDYSCTNDQEAGFCLRRAGTEDKVISRTVVDNSVYYDYIKAGNAATEPWTVTSDDGYTIDYQWVWVEYRDDMPFNTHPMEPGEKFIAGSSYSLKGAMHPLPGYVFADDIMIDDGRGNLHKGCPFESGEGQVMYVPPEFITAKEDIYVPEADINADGIVDIMDMTGLMKNLANGRGGVGTDINSDGNADILDLIAIMKLISQ